MSKHSHEWNGSQTEQTCDCGAKRVMSPTTSKWNYSYSKPSLVQPSSASNKPIIDLFMWVSRSAYSEVSFIDEAKQMGVCKRVAAYPNDITIGKSRIFFGFSGTEPKTCFGYTVISEAMYVVKKGTNLPEEFKARNVIPLSQDEALLVAERGCGKLVPEGLYVLGKTYELTKADIAKMSDLIDDIQLNGPIAAFKTPIQLDQNDKAFRGYRYIDSSVLLKTHSLAKAVNAAAPIRKEIDAWRKENKVKIPRPKHAKPKSELTLKEAVLKVIGKEAIPRTTLTKLANDLRPTTSKYGSAIYFRVIASLIKHKTLTADKEGNISRA